MPSTERTGFEFPSDPNNHQRKRRIAIKRETGRDPTTSCEGRQLYSSVCGNALKRRISGRPFRALSCSEVNLRGTWRMVLSQQYSHFHQGSRLRYKVTKDNACSSTCTLATTSRHAEQKSIAATKNGNLCISWPKWISLTLTILTCKRFFTRFMTP